MSFSKLGAQFTVNTTIGDDQYGSSVTQLTNGDIVVAWNENTGSSINIRGQILTSGGLTKSGGELSLNTSTAGNQYDVDVTALGNGGFVAGWTSSAARPASANEPFDLDNNAEQSHVVTQVFDAAGTKVGGEDTRFLAEGDYHSDFALLYPLDKHTQSAAALTADLSVNSDSFDLFTAEEAYMHHTGFIGLFWVTEWGENNIGHYSGNSGEMLTTPVEDVTWDYANLGGTPVPIQPAEFDEPVVFDNPDAITLANGEIVTAYERHNWDGTSSAAWLEKRVWVDFENGAEIQLGGDYSEDPSLAELTNGNIVVVWEDDDVFTGLADNIKGQRFTPDGVKIGGEFTIDSASASATDPAVAGLADGRFMVVWTDYDGDGDGTAVKGQVFTSGGVKSGEDFIVNTSTADNQTLPTITALANGDALVTWTDDFGSTTDIYAQVLDLQVYDGTSSGDSVYGGSFDDTLYGGAGNDTLRGRDGNDLLLGDGDDDQLYGLGGNDTLTGGTGNDTLRGGIGNDVYNVIDVNDAVIENPDEGVDIVNTTIDYTLGANVENLTGLSVFAGLSLTGNSLNNIITGGLQDDTLSGLAGDDTLNGAGDNDSLVGGSGYDYLDGGTGNDTMEGGSGSDTYFVDSPGDVVVEAAIGNDTMDYVSSTIDYTLGAYVERLGLEGTADLDGTGNTAANHLFGNSGANVLSGLSGNDSLYGYAGRDRLYGGSEDDRLDGGADDDDLFGEGGNDTLIGGSEDDELDGGTGADSMSGGGGNDLYVVDDAGDVVTELFGEGASDLVLSSIGLVLAANVENLWLTGSGNLYGTGNGRDNIIIGNAGNNALSGFAGTDHLYGSDGHDVLWGGGGGDELDGGNGIDTAIYTGSTDSVYADLGANLFFGGHANGDTLVGIENLSGSAHADVLVGDANANILAGIGGADSLFGAAGDDTLLGGADDDSLVGGEGADVLGGGGGQDTVSYRTATAGVTADLGNAAVNTGDAAGDRYYNVEELEGSAYDDGLTGDALANVIAGGLGQDTLTGGAGADTFRFVDPADTPVGPATRDIIADFSSADGDLVDLSAIDADVNAAGDQAFVFIGTAAFSATAGELRFTGADPGFVIGDVDGDGIQDFTIELAAVTAMAAGDFIL